MSAPHDYQDNVPETSAAVPIAVRIVGNDTTQDQAANLSAFASFILTGTETSFRLLGRNPKRSIAHVMIALGSTGHVWVGKRDQVDKPLGMYMSAGDKFDYEAEPELWIRPAGDSGVTVNISDEWFL